MAEKQYDHQVCSTCAKNYGDPNKGGIGMWKGTCELCGEEGYLAMASYDFGISPERFDLIKGFMVSMREASKDKWGMV